MIVPTDFKTQILAMLSAMSEKLGVAGAHLWEVLVRQEVIYGYWCVGASVLFVSIFAVLIVIAYKTFYSRCIDRDYLPVLVFSEILVAMVFLLVSLGYSLNAITGIANPEYAALDNIVKKVQGK